jgi:hypothetical protein
MTTQEMYDNGLRCKGRGFNCPGCKDKSGCVEYVNEDIKPKPPLGIMSRSIWNSKRLDDLNSAINRYYETGFKVPIEWLEEYSDLIVEYNEGR